MALDTISDAPTAESFTPLSEHQSQTPGTFFGGRPVLHYHSAEAKIRTSRTEYDQFTALHNLDDAPRRHSASNGESGVAEDVVISGVDVWVTSK